MLSNHEATISGRPVGLGGGTGSDADPSTDFSRFFMIFHDFSYVYIYIYVPKLIC